MNIPVTSTTLAAQTIARTLLDTALGFRECAPATRERMVQDGRIMVYGKSETIMVAGEPADSLCLVLSGVIEASQHRNNGRRHLLGYLQAGDISGFLGLLDGHGYLNDLIARNHDTTVMLIPGATIRQLEEQDSKLDRAIAVQIAVRTRQLVARLAADTSLTADVRLARLLVTLGRLYGKQQHHGLQLSIKLAQSDLADLLGISRQRINFAIQSLRDEKLIDLAYSTVIIIDERRLIAHAEL